LPKMPYFAKPFQKPMFMGMNEKLFKEFPPVSTSEWEEKINNDLKGAPYEKLIWKTLNGFSVRPYYREEDLKTLPHFNADSGESGVFRAGKIAGNDWEIRQDIKVKNFKEANKTALDALNKGATSLGFIISDEIKLTQTGFSELLKDIIIECININFIVETQFKLLAELLIQECKIRKIESSKINGSINADPLSLLISKADLSHSPEELLDKFTGYVSEMSDVFPSLKSIGINTNVLHNAGASIVQELGIGLSMVSDYMEKLTENGMKEDTAAKAFLMNVAVGSQYFPEIAKNRAVRILFRLLMESWNVKDEVSKQIFIHSSTSEWNQTVYDPYVNMLRGTTEGMSAVLGGADSLSVTPFDKAFRETTAFSERIARNTQIILKEEAYLDKVADPSAGSYYIESLTGSIVENAWKLFLEIEEVGGYLKSVKSGMIQNMVRDMATQRDLNIAIRKEILLGTNQYPNAQEKLHEDYNIKKATDTLAGNRGISLLKKYRGAEAFEELRIKTEMSGLEPKVFLLNYGNPTWAKARAGFASAFFACAGYQIIDNQVFDSPDEGIKAANNAKANIVVLCSSDDEYASSAANAFKQIDSKPIFVIAGYPKDAMEDLKKEGIEHFIHVKSKLLEELQNFNKLMGIN
jgi:methylmalonyl-CoA mutase